VIPRQKILEKFRAMMAEGVPIIGGGAGTGLSAKCEEAGGIDLIVIYNSGRYRMAGRGSLAGLLAYGDANQIVVEMGAEVLPVVRHTPVLAGVNGTDPFRKMDVFLDDLKRMGFSGVQNFPTVGLIDGIFRANLEETGMSYGLEVDMIAAARAKDMLTTPYVFNEDDATAMARAGAGRRLGGSGPQGRPPSDRARPWWSCRNAGGRRVHLEQHIQLPRLLRRVLDGAPANGNRPDRTNAHVQAHRPPGSTVAADTAPREQRTCPYREK
jgi:hypothetical protein